MEKGVGRVIYESIKTNQWLEIDYQKENEVTHFWIGVKSLDIKNKIIACKMINVFINKNKIIDSRIYAEKIIRASILKGSYFECEDNLLERIDEDYKNAEWLEATVFNENILSYITECNRLDNDPYIKDSYSIGELSFESLSNTKVFKASREAMDKLLNVIIKLNRDEALNKQAYLELAMNKLAISIGERDYVIAYYKLNVDFSTNTIHLDTNPIINKSFLVEGRKYSIFSYIDCDADEFVESFIDDYDYYEDMIKNNLRAGEKINTREEIFVLRRDFICDIEGLADSIIKMEENDDLSKPIRAYFGQNISKRKARIKDPFIVLRNNDANIDQIRAVYNTMTNFITYVEGPPGTGKTKTIVNVILSAMANNMSCLICSNNNKPINDIYDSIKFQYIRKDGKAADVLFPIIRIGNNEENLKAIKALKDFYYSAQKIKFLNEKLTNESKENALSSYSKLKEFIDSYEEKIAIKENLSRLIKLRKGINDKRTLNSIDAKIEGLRDKLEKYSDITDANIKQYVISAWDNKDYQNYLFFNSQLYIKKLLDKKNSDLIDIIMLEDENEAVRQFNKYLSNDDNLKRFISIFPFVLTTNLSASKLGSNSIHFDLCIMDEAGQCNIATSLIPIVRAKSLLMLGDTNQLKPVIVLESNVNKALMKKYNIGNEYDYLNNSILSLMRSKDETSKNIILRYHYRCPKKIIEFCNHSFYNDELIVENKNDAELMLCNVNNLERVEGKRNAYVDEAKNVVKLIKENGYDDCTVITPFKNQAELINKYLREAGIENISAGTIHTVQGAEKNTIIFSSAISKNTSERTFNWLKNNEQLLNVGLSRAKKRFIMMCNRESLEILDKGENSGLYQLANYVETKGDIRVLKPINEDVNGFSNNSTAEAELYETLRPYFEARGSFVYKRNQKVNIVLKLGKDAPYQSYYNKAEFDGVIYKRNAFNELTPILIIELDGGEHICCEKTIKRDRKKEVICKNARIKILRIPNSLTKDFKYLMEVLENILNERSLRQTLWDLDDLE